MQREVHAILTKNLTKRFDGLRAVDHLNLKIERGTICGLLGPNGAGKTTLIGMLIGALKPTTGTAKILGKDVREASLRIRKKIAYLPENCGFYENMSGFRFLRYMAELGGLRRPQATNKASKLLEQMELSNRKNSKIATYSGGMKQRLAIAQSFITDPEVVFLDEPTAELDPIVREEILEMIKNYVNKDRTVLIASHILPEIKKISDVVAVMDKGKIQAKARLEEISSLETFYKKALTR